jgi:hypothetical protein
MILSLVIPVSAKALKLPIKAKIAAMETVLTKLGISDLYVIERFIIGS